MKRLIKISVLALMVVLTMTGCKKSYTIIVKSNVDAWGSVTGAGTYKDGEVVKISAIPADGYFFVGWNDGNADNPREIVVSGDAEYIATFSDTPGGGGVEGAVSVSGEISSNTTWKNHSSGVDYLIDGYFFVGGNALLTIEPGVTIMFTGVDGAIVVGENAGLRMVGTADKPIILTGPTNNQNPGAWSRVEVTSNRNDNQFEYVYFVNGGSYNYEVLGLSGKLSMKHCVIDNAAGDGVSLFWDGTFTEFENNTIKRVGGYPVVLPAHRRVNCLGSGNTYMNNIHNMIRIDEDWAPLENVTVTYSNQGIPYYLPDGAHYGHNATVKVNPGVDFVVGYDKYVRADEDVLYQVNGTASQPVSFSGYDNENGYWNGIEIATTRQTNGGSNLSYCNIMNAGKSFQKGVLVTGEDTRLALNNVNIYGSNGYGMEIAIPLNDDEEYNFSNYHVTATGLTFANCARGNIYEVNKEQVFSTMPGSKKLAGK